MLKVDATVKLTKKQVEEAIRKYIAEHVDHPIDKIDFACYNVGTSFHTVYDLSSATVHLIV